MKVFEFDPSTGKRGAFIGDIERPQAFGNPGMVKCALPRQDRDANWTVATFAKDSRNNPVTFDSPVCFCLGKWTAGTDTAWQWIALLSG